jgi:23S rRNA pseudoU1915 N3-methylase RlmH
MKILIKDELLSGKSVNEMELDFSSETVTVKDVISARVKKEVEDYNKRLPEYFNGLVEPLDAEKTLNGYKLKAKKVIDAEKQIYIALDAFQKNGFFVLIDHQQADLLDEQIVLKATTTISFVKLTPLVGG